MTEAHDAAPFPHIAADSLLLGCGYLGAAMLPGLGGTVRAVTRGTARHAALSASGARCLAADLAAPDLDARLAPHLEGFDGLVFVLAPPSAWPGEEVAPAFARLLALLARLRVRRGVLASSTAVYGDAAGAVIGADAPLDETAPRSRKLVAIERAWLAADFDARVVRLAGLYGPGRVIGLDSVRSGDALPGDGEAWLNLLHIEDAARAMLTTALAPAPLRAALISDGTPQRRRDYYAALAAQLGAPAPRFGAEGGRGVGSRRCDPRSSWAALGCAPRWPDARLALAPTLELSGR
ncbi:MAG: NAD-dependent epimerase/dehydratase family protein [Gammaproteobacteria bacterium]